MDIEEFERAVRDRDFAIGDSFWINGVEFEVVNREKIFSTEKNQQYEHKYER